MCKTLFKQRHLVDNSLLSMNRFRAPALGELANYAVSGGEIGPETKALVSRRNDALFEAAVSICAARRDPKLKSLLINKINKATADEYELAEMVEIYFGVVGTEEDLQDLENFATRFGQGTPKNRKNWTLWNRLHVENAIRTIRMRAFVGSGD